MLNLTRAAAERILVAASDAGGADWALRVAARRESDGSVTYGMGFDEPRQGDMPLHVQGVPLLIAPPSQPMLESTVLDFVELEPGRFEFIFVAEAQAAEPAAKACGSGGCGSCSA